MPQYAKKGLFSLLHIEN